MKSAIKDLCVITIYSMVGTTAAIIGLGIGGTIWSEKVEPWINKKLGD